MRVLVVDDHEVFADSLVMALEAQSDIEWTGSASSVDDALPMVDEKTPDIVLMDAYLPGTGGIEGLRQIRASHPETRVFILTGHAEIDLLAEAASAGASGFVPKESSFDRVLEAIRSPGDDQMFVETTTLLHLVDRVRSLEGAPKPPHRPVDLTPREREVLHMLAEGLDVRAISETLRISVHTCRGHVKSLLTKLQAHSQLEAVVIAARHGLLPGHPLED